MSPANDEIQAMGEKEVISDSSHVTNRPGQDETDKTSVNSFIPSDKPLKRSIGWKLLTLILFFSSLITLLLTAGQLYFDFRRDVTSIEARFGEIESSYLTSIAGSLWHLDRSQLQSQLEGIVRLPDMQYAELRDTTDDTAPSVNMTAGDKMGQSVISRELAIVYRDRGAAQIIGMLHIEATLDHVYQRLIDKTLVILGSQGVKTFLVSFFILFVVFRLITRHLGKIADHLNRYNLDAPMPAMSLDRYPGKQLDEIDQVVNAFNELEKNLMGAHKNLRQANINLEQRVEERTSELKKEISFRMKAEDAIRKSEERIRLLFETVGAIIVVLDPEGKIQEFNKEAERIYKVKRDDVIGKNYFDLFIPDEARPSVLRDMKKVLSGVPTIGFENPVAANDGVVSLVMWNVTRLLDEFGRPSGIIAAGQDITERKKAEARMQQVMLQAEAANRAKSDLLANMSHELRTPLNAIIGFSDSMIAETFGPIGDDRYREYLSDIHYSGQHLLELINDILEVSSIEAGALKLQEEKINIDEIVDASIRLVKARADNGKLKLSSSIAPELPELYADPRRIKQVLLNLLSNAVKFTLEKGEISVNSWLAENGSITISVSDSGIGMDEKEVKVALSKFGQVDSGLDRKHEGTGLGLTLSKGLLELHGGRLDIESGKGKGTLVSMHFPPERTVLN